MARRAVAHAKGCARGRGDTNVPVILGSAFQRFLLLVAGVVAFVTLLPAFGERAVRRSVVPSAQISVAELRGKTLVTAHHELRYAEPNDGDRIEDDDADTSRPDDVLDAPDGGGDDEPSAAATRLGIALVAPPADRAPAGVFAETRPGILLFRRMVRPG